MKRFGILFLFLAVLFLGAQAVLANKSCPDPAELKETLKTLFAKQDFKVASVGPAPVEGLCEVILEAQGGKKLTYVDKNGRYLVVGRIIDIKARKDLTQERVTDLNRLSPAKLKELEELVAFSVGKGPEIFFVTDPDCPHCKRAEKILLPLAKEGKIKVKVILFPLEALHPKAKEKAVAIICDGKGLEALIEGYQGKQCEAGLKKVEKTIATLPKLGIRATPTYIFPDGRVISGVLSAEQLLRMVK
ncbi:MAG: DsbC family protein [Thermodesulfobacteria bacterium]|nr:DsbC family protein [Thermodesulfobacteriota bacterium]